jgi:hypothetical protein
VTICLEPEQLALFEELLEAWRGVPRDQRQPFLYIQLMAGNVIQGNGIDKASVPDGDVEELRAEGLISFDGDSFTIPARSIATYQEWKGSHVEPVADVEAQIPPVPGYWTRCMPGPAHSTTSSRSACVVACDIGSVPR